MSNPFEVQTPENLSTDEMADLFVHANSDYYQVEKAGHTFIKGPRGAGKSMYFRFLEPDCQMQDKEKNLNELSFYAAYIPIKETDLNLPELFRLQATKHAAMVLNEHSLIVHVAAKIFISLRDRAKLETCNHKDASAFRTFLDDVLCVLLKRSGWAGEYKILGENPSVTETLSAIIGIFDEIFSELNSYTRSLAFAQEIIPYNKTLFGYSDFLAPMIRSLMNLSFMPSGPIFLLIDDADNLNKSQTLILNSWVARRTTGYICLKISAQEGEYKTYNAVGGIRIDAPHDYSEFNISDKYTTKSDNYKTRVSEIITRRLAKYGVSATPDEFFPENKNQEDAIKLIGEEIKKNWESKGKGFRPGDDALRYARPNYMKGLSEAGRKSGSTYSYAGFNQIVHLSSGIVRHLLETSSLMYAEAESRADDDKEIKFIPDSIQNSVLKEYSDRLLFTEFEKLEQAEGDKSLPIDDPTKLKHLIQALGGMFRTILVSEASERRVFSIAFSNGPDHEVMRILNLGVKYGYFHKSTIGNKEGTGRVPLFIMTRRLAPSFKLDPTSFAGYKFVTNDKILEALYSPTKLIREVKIKGFETVMSVSEQKGLFEDD